MSDTTETKRVRTGFYRREDGTFFKRVAGVDTPIDVPQEAKDWLWFVGYKKFLAEGHAHEDIVSGVARPNWTPPAGKVTAPKANRDELWLQAIAYAYSVKEPNQPNPIDWARRLTPEQVDQAKKTPLVKAKYDELTGKTSPFDALLAVAA